MSKGDTVDRIKDAISHSPDAINKLRALINGRHLNMISNRELESIIQEVLRIAMGDAK